jgi:hypothetical protein
MNATPQPGMFIREVMGFRTGYCLEVVRVLDCDDTHGPGIKHITAKRWGVDDHGQPVDDGRSGESYYADRIRPVRNKAWRFLNGQAWDSKPMYWRQIDIEPAVGQQQDLFQ